MERHSETQETPSQPSGPDAHTTNGAGTSVSESGFVLARKDLYPRMALGTLVTIATAALGVHLNWLFSTPSLESAVTRASGWIKVFTGPELSGVVFVFGPLALTIGVVIGLLIHYGMPQFWQSARRSFQVGVLLGVCLFAVWLVGTSNIWELKGINWVFFVPVVPPIMLAYQALLAWRQRPRSFGDFRIGVSNGVEAALSHNGDLTRFHQVYNQLVAVFGGPKITKPGESRKSTESRSRPVTSRPTRGVYDPASFATHFAVPGLVLLIVGFGAVAFATSDDPFTTVMGSVSSWNVLPETVALFRRGIQWGVAGAFVYVFIDFGTRFFRNDLTVGAATWAIVTLILGPALAVVLALGWQMQPGPSPRQTGIVLFFAGWAPRRVVTILEAAALQLLNSPNQATSKSMPLTNLSGISPELAARLREENIEDVVGLSYADPIRLVQSVPYDLRQVIDWIDQAQLAVALPRQYDTLRERGVAGAIDLAWRWLNASLEGEGEQTRVVPKAQPPASFRALVSDADRDAAIVYETGAQLFYEEQVRLLWVMYNCFSTTAVDQDPVPVAVEPDTPARAA